MSPRTFGRFLSLLWIACGLLAACSPWSPPASAQTELERAQAAADAGRKHPAAAPPPAVPGLLGLADAQGFAELDWTHMMPKEDFAILRDAPPVIHVGNHQGAQFGTLHTIVALNNQRVRLTGYVVPLETDAEGKMTEFFFVPFYGACIHVPPPPPNMLIHVSLSKAIDTPQIWDPFWLRGVMHTETQRNAIAASAYAMRDAELVPYSDTAKAPDDHFE
jgi:uncharacterized protein